MRVIEEEITTYGLKGIVGCDCGCIVINPCPTIQVGCS